MNMWYWVLFICLSQSTINTHALGLPAPESSGGKVLVDIYDYKNCPEKDDLTLQIQNIDIEKDPETDMLYISGLLVTEVKIDENLKSYITILKCSTEADESCMKYLTYEYDNLCDILWKKDTPSYEFTSRTKGLASKCPINPGSYEVEEVPVNSTGAIPPGSDGHWRMQYDAKLEGKVVSCIIISAEVKTKREL